ncbi:hypothetical protein, partial [Streptomyces sp. NPDC056061]|uniref:hypothetical protein n=1 Tax=Streptomyces sp. NPDC056061 TaxID=3345700 RepID=UPI0035E0E7A1
MGTHIGRSWDGPGDLEAMCPCPKAPCGLVDRDNVADSCEQHPPTRCKTIRTSHPADECSGVGLDVVLVMRRTFEAREHVVREAVSEEEGYFSVGLLDALDGYRAAVEHEAAERIRAEFHEAFEASQEVLSGTDAMLAADLIDPEV